MPPDGLKMTRAGALTSPGRAYAPVDDDVDGGVFMSPALSSARVLQQCGGFFGASWARRCCRSAINGRFFWRETEPITSYSVC